MSTPTPRPALKATGVRRRDARCPEAELATLTTERDHWQKIAVSASREREHNANEAGRLRAEVERLKRDYKYDHKCLYEVRERCESWKQRAERAEAEVERLRSDRDCEKRLRKDADEFRENAIERATKAEAEVERLSAGIAACLDTNGHLADGEDCTLIGLKRCFNNPTAARESNGGAA